MISHAIRFVAITLFLAAPAMAQEDGPVPPSNTPKEQGSQSGLPLSYYCNRVPDLGIDRRDSVDNWVKICTVYFKARSNQQEQPRKPRRVPNRPPRK